MTLPWPLPFPKPPPSPFDFDFGAFFGDVKQHIRDSREIRGQLMTGFKVGQEHLADDDTPPRIVVVPKGFRYRPARKFEDASIEFVKRQLWSWWLDLEVHCWGDPDPQGLDVSRGWSNAAELARQFLVALAAKNGGTPRVDPGSAEWRQDSNWERLGRLLVLRPAFERHVSKDSAITIPGATSTTGGVNVQVQPSIVDPGSGSTTNVAAFTVP